MKNKILLIAAMVLIIGGVVLLRVSRNTDPVAAMKKTLKGSWKGAEVAGGTSMTLNFVNDHDLEISLREKYSCTYDVNNRQELIIADSVRSTTYEILHLTNDSLELKTEYEVLLFVRDGAGAR